MTETLQTNDPDAMVLLKAAANQFCGKECDGEELSPRAHIKHWIPNISIISDVQKLHQVIRTLNKQRSYCIVRGMLKDQEFIKGEKTVRRCKQEEDPFTEAPRRWVALDHDGAETDSSLSIEEQVQNLIAQYPPEFANTSYVYQATSSYGIKPGLFVRIFWLLDEPTDNGHLKAYFSQFPELKTDTSLFTPVQPHYTTAPIFAENAVVPIELEERVGIVEGIMDRVYLQSALDAVEVKEIDYTENVTLGEGNSAQISHSMEQLLLQDPGHSRHLSLMGIMTELVSIGCPAQEAILFGYRYLEHHGRAPNADHEVEDVYEHILSKVQSGQAKTNVARLDDVFPDYEDGEDLLPEDADNGMEDVLGYTNKIKYAYSNAQTYLSKNYKDGGLLRWRQEFWEWRDGCYRPMEDEELYSDLVQETQFAPSVATAVEKSLIGITYKKGLDANSFLDERGKENMVVFNNGMLPLGDLLRDRFMPLQDHTPTFFNTHRLGFTYDPHATCPTWKKFLFDCFGSDEQQIREFGKMFGYLLTGDKSQQKFFVFQGAPRCGKGTVFSVLGKLMGDDNCRSLMLSSLSNEFALQPLVGKSLWLMDEVNEQNSRNIDGKTIDLIKAQVGGSLLQINRKGKAMIQAELDGRIIMACNRMPGFLDPSGAIASRMVLFRFVNCFVGKENVKLSMQLRAELAGIFNWALQGVLDLMEDGKFCTPESVKEMTDSYQEAMSPFKSFMDTNLEKDPDGQIEVMDLYKVYEAWARESNRPPVAVQKFGLEVLQHGWDLKKERTCEKGRRPYVYKGVKLTYEGQEKLSQNSGFD